MSDRGVVSRSILYNETFIIVYVRSNTRTWSVSLVRFAFIRAASIPSLHRGLRRDSRAWDGGVYLRALRALSQYL